MIKKTRSGDGASNGGGLPSLRAMPGSRLRWPIGTRVRIGNAEEVYLGPRYVEAIGKTLEIMECTLRDGSKIELFATEDQLRNAIILPENVEAWRGADGPREKGE